MAYKPSAEEETLVKHLFDDQAHGIIGTLNSFGLVRLHVKAKAYVVIGALTRLIGDYRLTYATASSGAYDGTDHRRFLCVAFHDEKHLHTAVVEIEDTNLSQGKSGHDIIATVTAGRPMPNEYIVFEAMSGEICLLGPRYIRALHPHYKVVVGPPEVYVDIDFCWPGDDKAFPLHIKCHDLRDFVPITKAILDGMVTVKDSDHRRRDLDLTNDLANLKVSDRASDASQ